MQIYIRILVLKFQNLANLFFLKKRMTWFLFILTAIQIKMTIICV